MSEKESPPANKDKYSSNESARRWGLEWTNKILRQHFCEDTTASFNLCLESTLPSCTSTEQVHAHTTYICIYTLRKHGMNWHHMVETSWSGNETLQFENETLQSGNETLQSGNDTLQFENETLQSGNETLQFENETLQSGNETLWSENESLKSRKHYSLGLRPCVVWN